MSSDTNDGPNIDILRAEKTPVKNRKRTILRDPLESLNVRSISRCHIQKNKICMGWAEAHCDFADAALLVKTDPSMTPILGILDVEINYWDKLITESGMRN